MAYVNDDDCRKHISAIKTLKKSDNEYVGDGKYPFTLSGIVDSIKYGRCCSSVHLFPTGSRYFGVSGYGSDYDICILSDDYSETGIITSALYSAFGYYVVMDGDYASGKKLVFKHNNEIINIIPLNVADYISWMIATDILKNISDINRESIVNKIDRVTSFEMFKNMTRKLIGDKATIKLIDQYNNTKLKDINILKKIDEIKTLLEGAK